MKKFLIVGLVVLLLAPFCTVQFKKQMYENRVEHFLFEEMAYKPEEIQSIESYWHFAGLPSYEVRVIFSDDPNVVYSYLVHHKDQLGQFEFYTKNGTMITAPENLKHYQPFE